VNQLVINFLNFEIVIIQFSSLYKAHELKNWVRPAHIYRWAFFNEPLDVFVTVGPYTKIEFFIGNLYQISFITASIARSAKRRYLSYSEADFEVFRPIGATRCTDGCEIWHGGVDEGPLLRAKFHPHRCNDKGIGPPQLKLLLRFHKTSEYTRPTGAYPLRDFHEICSICTSFQSALTGKIWMDLRNGLHSCGGFKLRGRVSPNIFSAP